MSNAGHFLRFVSWFPRRLRRLLYHFPQGIARLLRGGHPFHWWTELLFLLGDLFGIFDLYDGLTPLYKRQTRPLNERELTLARSVYGTTIDWSAVRLDEGAKIACRRHHLCYVSFYTINSWGSMPDATLLHELMHVWQYERYGAVYIPRALRAQRTAEGYNYGGAEMLRKRRAAGRDLHDFNYEQQADIVADAFRIERGLRPRWGYGSDPSIYRAYLEDLRTGSQNGFMV